MAQMLVRGDDVVVRLSWWEKVVARRGDVRLPLAAVCRVTVEGDWWRVLRGDSLRGVWVPGALCVGTRAHQGGEDFVAVRPGRPVVCVELRPSAPFRLLAVSVRAGPEAQATAEGLRRSAPDIDTSTPWRQPLPVPEEEPASEPTGQGIVTPAALDHAAPGPAQHMAPRTGPSVTVRSRRPVLRSRPRE